MNRMKVNLHNQTEVEIKHIKKIMHAIFKHVKEKKSMEVVFMTQDQIHDMNKTYRQIDKPTDVLSFPNEDENIKSLGDICISIEQAEKQAQDYGHSFEREIGFLAVHGYLHLKGYDHHTDEEEKIMTEMQEHMLKKAKLERRSL